MTNEGLGKEHMDTIDYDAPRDFMDTMLNEANNNESEIGYHTIAMSIVGILVFKSLWRRVCHLSVTLRSDPAGPMTPKSVCLTYAGNWNLEWYS